MPRKPGFPLSRQWGKGPLWRKWDLLSSQERLDYEDHYENKDNSLIAKIIRKFNESRISRKEI